MKPVKNDSKRKPMKKTKQKPSTKARTKARTKVSVQSRTIIFPDGQKIVYELTRKPVKNINIRVKSDGRILVSASRSVPLKYLDELMLARQDFISKALKKYDDLRKKKEARIEQGQVLHDEKILMQICQEIYPLFAPMGVEFPQIKIRTMKTQWGSCRPYEGIITLNRRLLEAPREAIEYVVLHEFAHFIHLNHSKDFYELVESLMPDWKERKAMLEGII